MSNARNLSNLLGTGTTIGTANIADEVFEANRNVLINGSMAVSQRGTSSTGQGASDLFLVDRFQLNTNGNSAGRYTVSQESDGPSGIPNSLKLACTTADTSIAAAERFFIEQRLEGQNCQRFKKGTSDAEKITVSFYVKGNAAATYVLGIYDNDNSRQIGATFSVTTSWARVSVTFPGDTGGSALGDDNAESLSLRFYLHAGSNYTSGTLQTTWGSASAASQVGSGTTSFFDSTSRTFFLTGVQMEVGEQTTPFEQEEFGITLAKCSRYYAKSWSYGNAVGTNPGVITASCVGSVHRAFGSVFWPVEMRTEPTVTWYSGSDGTEDKWRNGSQGTNITPPSPMAAIGTKGYGFVLSSGISAITDSLQGHYEAEAEL